VSTVLLDTIHFRSLDKERYAVDIADTLYCQQSTMGSRTIPTGQVSLWRRGWGVAVMGSTAGWGVM